MQIAKKLGSCAQNWHFLPTTLVALILSMGAAAQTCTSGPDLDAPTRASLEAAGRRYFDLTAKGDVASLKQGSIPTVAANFGAIEAAVKDNQPDFAGATPSLRPLFLLEAEGKEPIPRAEFLCGVFGKTGQTADSAVFVIPNLPPGTYAVVILDVAEKLPHTLSLVLQKSGSDWKLAGFYAKASQVAGHDGQWFWDRARAFKAKGQTHNAWLYYNQARDLLAPVPFMSTITTDRIYDESQPLQPPDLPSGGNSTDLSFEGKTYRLTNAFAVGVGNDIDLVVKYQAADISNTNRTYQENVAVIKALAVKYPEFRQGFTAIIARAVEPSGKDYGTLLALKDVK
jgi:hypothetical protein